METLILGGSYHGEYTDAESDTIEMVNKHDMSMRLPFTDSNQRVTRVVMRAERYCKKTVELFEHSVKAYVIDGMSDDDVISAARKLGLLGDRRGYFEKHRCSAILRLPDGVMARQPLPEWEVHGRLAHILADGLIGKGVSVVETFPDREARQQLYVFTEDELEQAITTFIAGLNNE